MKSHKDDKSSGPCKRCTKSEQTDSDDDPVEASVILSNDKIPISALIDSGALLGNYVTEEIAEAMVAKGANDVKERSGQVHSYSGRDCSPISKDISMSLRFKSNKFPKRKRVTFRASILKDLDHDVIVGLPTIQRFKLWKLLRKSSSPTRALKTFNKLNFTPATAGKEPLSLRGKRQRVARLKRRESLAAMTPSALEVTSIAASLTGVGSEGTRTLIPSRHPTGKADVDGEPSQDDAPTQTAGVNSSSIARKVLINRSRSSTRASLDNVNETIPAEVPEGTRFTKEELMQEAPADDAESMLHEEYSPYDVVQDGVSLLQLLEESIVGSEKLRAKLRILCHEFIDIFDTKVRTQAARVAPMHVDVDETKWHTNNNRGRARMFSPEKEAEIKKQIDALLAIGAIKKSQAMYHSQVHLTPKGGGGWRMCIDYRNLNNACKGMGWPLPIVQTMLSRLGEKKPRLFAKMDMPSGYHQAPLSKQCQAATAFICSRGLYEWCRVPMGLKVSTAYFQDMMQNVLGELVGDTVEVYLDDILAFAQTEEELLDVLRDVFTRLRRASIVLNPKKCRFGMSQVEFVGHTVDAQGLSFSQEKRDSVLEVILPQTQRQLRAFLGLTNYFRDHVEHYADHAHSLQELLTGEGSNRPVTWNPIALAAFDNLKRLVHECPRRYHLREGAPLTLRTDASDYGIGAYLFQLWEGVEEPIGFMSKAFSSVQKRWSTPEKEAYAIYYSLDKWQHILLGPHFTIKTDHRNLTYISTHGSAKVMRWKLAVQIFNFDISHIAGKDNIVADHLSRLIETGPKNELLLALADLPIPNLRYEALKAVHNGEVGHNGVERTLALLDAKGLRWRGRRVHTRKFIKECPCCQKFDERRIANKAHPFTLSSYTAFERVHVDSIGPLQVSEGFEHIMVVMDGFTRFTELYTLQSVAGKEAAKGLLDFANRYGLPSVLISDGGTQFVNQHVKDLLQSHGVEMLTTNPDSHEENGLVERTNKEVVRHLRSLMFDIGTLDGWHEHIRSVQRILNSAPHSSLGTSPATLVYGKAVDLLKGVVTELPKSEESIAPTTEWLQDRLSSQEALHAKVKETLQKMDKIHMSTRSGGEEITQFAVGDHVLVATPTGGRFTAPVRKLKSKRRGPMEVVSYNQSMYVVRDLNHRHKTKTVHVCRLIPFIFDATRVDPADVARVDNEEFEVEHIVKHKGGKFKRGMAVSNLQFLVKWKDYDEAANTWEPWNAMRETIPVHEYLRANNAEYLIPRQFL